MAAKVYCRHPGHAMQAPHGSHSHRLGPLLTPSEEMVTKGRMLSGFVTLLSINVYITPDDLNIIIPISRTGKYFGLS